MIFQSFRSQCEPALRPIPAADDSPLPARGLLETTRPDACRTPPPVGDSMRVHGTPVVKEPGSLEAAPPTDDGRSHGGLSTWRRSVGRTDIRTISTQEFTDMAPSFDRWCSRVMKGLRPRGWCTFTPSGAFQFPCLPSSLPRRQRSPPSHL